MMTPEWINVVTFGCLIGYAIAVFCMGISTGRRIK